MTPTQEALAFAYLSGPDGVIARLVLQWDPSTLPVWLAGELARGTPMEHIALALGEVMAAASYAVLNALPPGVDRLGYLNGDRGIPGQLKARLERRFEQEQRPKGLLLPGAN